MEKPQAGEAAEETKKEPSQSLFGGGNSEETVRKNALQIKQETEALEKEILEKEQIWDTPAFLRKKMAKE